MSVLSVNDLETNVVCKHMKFTERPNLRAIDYLHNQTDDELERCCYPEGGNAHLILKHGKHSLSKKQKKATVTILRNYIAACVQAGGMLEVEYSQRKGQGRLFGNPSTQNAKRVVRHVLFRDTTVDVDMVNAHPVLLRWLCKKHLPDLPVVNLEHYIHNREKCYQDAMKAKKELSRGMVKTLHLKCLNREGRMPPDERVTPFLEEFDKEMKKTMESLCHVEALKKYVSKGNGANVQGKFMAALLQDFEHQTLQVAMQELQRQGFEIAVPMHDGCLIYKSHERVLDDTVLEALAGVCNRKFPSLDIKWAYKDHGTELHVPDEYEERGFQNRYDTAKAEFERCHFKVVEEGSFGKRQQDGSVTWFSKSNLVDAYEDHPCPMFIKDWLVDSKKQKYRCTGVYPPDQTCPSDVYNLWLPDAMSLVTDYTPDREGMNLLLAHIRTVINGEEQSNYFLMWVAHMIQHPSRKAVMINLIGSKEGGGKGSLVDVLRRLIGEKKLLETTSPSKDVFGAFNGQMEHASLVYLNEMSAKEMSGTEEYLKGMITDASFIINQKYQKARQVTSYHRFISSSNNLNPKKVTKGSRRDLTILCSNDLVENKPYFAKLHAAIDNQNCTKTLYEHFLNMDCTGFEGMVVPKTAFQEELEDEADTPEYLWFRDWAVDNYHENWCWSPQRFQVMDVYGDFCKWYGKRHPDYGLKPQHKFTSEFRHRVLSRVVGENYTSCWKKSNGRNWYCVDKDVVEQHFGIGSAGCYSSDGE